MSGTIQSRAKRPPVPPPPVGPGSGLARRNPPILRGKGGRPREEQRPRRRRQTLGRGTRTRRRWELSAPGEPSLVAFGKAAEDPFLRVFFYPKQSET